MARKGQMKSFLIVLLSVIMAGMVAVNLWAGLQINLFDAWPDYKENPWAIATLADAYAGFITFYVWVAYRERHYAARLTWFLLIMGLGTITMSLYVLLQLRGLKPAEPLSALLLRKAEA